MYSIVFMLFFLQTKVQFIQEFQKIYYKQRYKILQHKNVLIIYRYKKNKYIFFLQGITYLNRNVILEPLAPLLPIQKNLPISNVQSLMLHKTSEISSFENTEIDTTTSQLKKLKMPESVLVTEQKTDLQEEKKLLTEDNKILANNSSADGENQNR